MCDVVISGRTMSAYKLKIMLIKQFKFRIIHSFFVDVVRRKCIQFDMSVNV